MIDSRYSSRKFVLAALLLVAALGLLIAGLIDPDTWSGFSTRVLGPYVTGNVGASFVGRTAK